MLVLPSWRSLSSSRRLLVFWELCGTDGIQHWQRTVRRLRHVEPRAHVRDNFRHPKIREFNPSQVHQVLQSKIFRESSDLRHQRLFPGIVGRTPCPYSVELYSQKWQTSRIVPSAIRLRALNCQSSVQWRLQAFRDRTQNNLQSKNQILPSTTFRISRQLLYGLQRHVCQRIFLSDKAGRISLFNSSKIWLLHE